MPRVLYLCHGHPAIVPGGTEAVAYDLFREVREREGCAAMYVGCVSPLHRQPRADTRLQAISRAADELLLWVGQFDRFALAQSEAGSFAESMVELLTSFRPEVVHFHHLSRLGLEAVLLTRRVLPRAKIVLTLHDYFAICPNDGLMTRQGSGQRCLEAALDSCHACLPHIPHHRFAARTLGLMNGLGQVDQFIAPSAFLRDRYIAWGLPTGKIEIIGNGLPEAPPAETPRRPRRTFGFFGNIAPHKGVLVALAAIRQLAQEHSDVRLRLHGGLNFQPEPFRRAFAEALSAAGPAAMHAGPYSRGELPKLLADVDWVVVPSVWWENAPLVILEAFQQRRPVICSDIGGMAEMVRDRVDGLHFRAGDADDLARVMRRAACQRGLWGRLTAQIPDPPDLVKTADRHLALYHSLLGYQEALSA